MNKNEAFFKGRGYFTEGDCWSKTKGESYILVDGDGIHESRLPPDEGPFRVGMYLRGGEQPLFFEIVEADRLVPTLDKAEKMLEDKAIDTTEIDGLAAMLNVACTVLADAPLVEVNGDIVRCGEFTIGKGKVQIGERCIDGHDEPIMEDGWTVEKNGIMQETFGDPRSAVKAVARTIFNERLNVVDEYLYKIESTNEAEQVF